jgi:hypothetical protein
VIKQYTMKMGGRYLHTFLNLTLDWGGYTLVTHW